MFIHTQVDIWSVGVIMYTLLIGKPPFQTKEVNAIYKKIKENTYEFPESILISSSSKNVVQSLLHSRPGRELMYYLKNRVQANGK